MKQFNLEEYLNDPSRKVVTRDGRNVRIICTDAKGICPVVGLVSYENYEVAFNITKDGRIDGVSDLFFVDDIPDFKPYDRVLTRGHSSLPWKANLFSNFKKVGGNPIAVCLQGTYLLNDIIPFDENKVGKIE